MSLLTNYNTSGTSGTSGFVDLSAVFPPYEILFLLISPAGNYIANPIDYGLNTTFNNSTYFVIPSLYASVLDDADNLSSQTFPLIISEKKSTGFLVTVRTTTTINLQSSIFLVCLVVYYNSETLNNVFDLYSGVQFITGNNVDIDIGTDFPNYVYSRFDTSTSNTTLNYEADINFSTKSSYPNPYATFASYETSTAARAHTLSSAANQFIFPSTTTGERSGTVYNISFLTFSTGSSLLYTLNTLAIFPPINRSNNIYLFNPQFNAIVNNTARPFKNLFPRCIMFTQTIPSESSTINFIFTIPTVVDPGSDYQVFVSYEYNTINGSQSTFNIFEASREGNNIIVSSKLTDQFTVTVTKNSSDIWDGSIVGLVIYTN